MMHPAQWILGEKLHDHQMCRVAMRHSSWWSVRNLCGDLDDPVFRKPCSGNLLPVFFYVTIIRHGDAGVTSIINGAQRSAVPSMPSCFSTNSTNSLTFAAGFPLGYTAYKP